MLRRPYALILAGLASAASLFFARPSSAGPAYVERLLRNSRHDAAHEGASVPREIEADATQLDRPPTSPLRLSRDIDRDEIAAKLSAAGLPEQLDAQGLVLWHIISDRNGSGQHVYFAIGLPLEGRAFTHDPEPERRVELRRRLDGARQKIVSEAARILELDEDAISVHERPIENCCGVGCQSCLLTKPEHAEIFTGLPPRPIER